MAEAAVSAGTSPASRAWPAHTVAFAVLASVVGTGLSLSGGVSMSWSLVSNPSHSLMLAAAGWWLTRSPAARRVGWLLLCSGMAAALGVLANGVAIVGHLNGWPHWQAAAWLDMTVWPLFVIPLVTVLPAIFPNGYAPTPGWRWVPRFGVAATALMTLASGIGPGPLPIGSGQANPLALPVGATLGAVADLVAIAAVLASVTSLVARWRNAGVTERQQLKFLCFAVALVVVIELIAGLMPHHVAQAGFFAIPFLLVGAIALAERRYGLYDIDPVIRRTAVFMAVTTVVFMVYLGVVSLLGTAVGHSPGLALIASAVVAGLAEPVRRRVQRLIGRLFYGQREEPLAALAGLRQRLAVATEQTDLALSTAESVADATRASHVSIRVVVDGELTEVAAVGTPGAEPRMEIPLEARGEYVGVLSVGPRAPGESYSGADRALLIELAHTIGTALHAVKLADDLRTSQEQAVHAITEERRRLRHDLHDGLGPLLSGIGLAIDGVCRELSDDDPLTRELATIGAEVRSAGTTVRRIIDALPPAAVADLGLASAVADHLERCADLPGAPRITFDVDGLEESVIPPAVADAAYFVVLEATTNVLRHAHADHCCVALRGDGTQLVVQVTDDGTGIGDSYVPGVGTTSMRRRTAEIGGELHLSQRPTAGTTLRATLPLQTASRQVPR